MTVWFIAHCIECDMKMPFRYYYDRSDWVGKHRVATGHRVTMFIEVKEQGNG